MWRQALISKQRMQIQVHPSEHGLLLFWVADILTIAGFATSEHLLRILVAAHRSILLRLLHDILELRPHTHGCSWMTFWQHCVAVTQAHSWPSWSCFLQQQRLRSPEKGSILRQPTWCGGALIFCTRPSNSRQKKTIKLKGQLHELLKAGEGQAKTLEQVPSHLGTSLSPDQILAAIVHRPALPGCMISVIAVCGHPSFQR